MNWLWTWGGACFGYRSGDDLRTHDGYHVGRLNGDRVYDRHGRYLGELRNSRMIRKCGSTMVVSYVFTPWAKVAAYVKYADYAGYAMPSGYEDFPTPSSFHSAA